MVIAFFGHAQMCGTLECERKIFNFLEKIVGEQCADIYLGGYGSFDSLAYACCKKYKERHPKLTLCFITPYMTIAYQENNLKYQRSRYDKIIFPEIEDRPPKFAIFYRNRWMVDKADYIVTYVNHAWGGAYATYEYAKKKGKSIIRLGEL